MINATDLKNGTTFLSGGSPYKVLKYSLVKMGRGGATVRVNAKNLVTGTTEDKTFSSNVKVEEVSTQKRKLQYLYQDEVNAVFIDPKSFEQIEINKKIIEDELVYIKEGASVDILFWDDTSVASGQSRPLSADIPPKVVMKVIETDPGVKGNSASNVYKVAKLENGLVTKVPLFIKIGEMVRVDTRTGEYVERASKS